MTVIPGLPVMLDGKGHPLKRKEPKPENNVQKGRDILERLTGQRYGAYQGSGPGFDYGLNGEF